MVQVEADQATACVRAAPEAGITMLTPQRRTRTVVAETILGDTLAGERRQGLEILTKIFGATGPGGPNDGGLSRKHIPDHDLTAGRSVSNQLSNYGGGQTRTHPASRGPR
jgi:aryl-alcohol dehydrogenase-like predicted oxidoreductase